MSTPHHEAAKHPHATHPHAKPREDAPEIAEAEKGMKVDKASAKAPPADESAAFGRRALELVEAVRPGPEHDITQGSGHWKNGWDAAINAVRAAFQGGQN